MRLKDKVAIVTGSGRGIGRAVALGFASEGTHVVVSARTEQEIKAVADEIRSLDRKALPVVCDVTMERQVKSLVAQTLETFDRVDILVNNAGTGLIRPVWGTPRPSFESVLAVNLIGTFLCTKHVWQPMRDGGGGSIINISSLAGLSGYRLLSAYCASKWGQIGFTLACAEEGKEDNIRVNAIAPGKVDTALRGQIQEDKTRMLKAEDHAGACIFLACDESRYITGHVIPLEWYGHMVEINGGQK
ncbi:MAG: SDR family NAD(P)-dependent oxidoreductase [Anaerolineales bacterium]|nr:SDR family NAD(P)-dependent oxidoreductase [Anaerolineales bacterium]